MKGTTKLLIATIISLFVVSWWDKYPIIKNSVGAVLDPSFGALLRWNIIVGFIIIVSILTLLQSLAQKYLTNQTELKELKKEQKILQEEMKKYKDQPQKVLELQKKSFEFLPKTMDLTMNSVLYTSIPFILLFRWFGIYLSPIWGGWWILYYIILSMIIGSFFRKALDIA